MHAHALGAFINCAICMVAKHTKLQFDHCIVTAVDNGVRQGKMAGLQIESARIQREMLILEVEIIRMEKIQFAERAHAAYMQRYPLLLLLSACVLAYSVVVVVVVVCVRVLVFVYIQNVYI